MGSPATERSAAPRLSPDPSAGRLLLLEDHLDTARVIERLLSRAGWHVTHARTVAEAKRLVAERPDDFDAVLSDIGLPDGRGTELAEVLPDRLRERSIAVSGYGTSEDILASERAGFRQHLVKPVDIDQLRVALAEVTGA